MVGILNQKDLLMNERRQDIVDIRAIAILIVMFGHSVIIYSSAWNLYSSAIDSVFLDSLKKVINVIQMPIFFSVSGFCMLYTLRTSAGFKHFTMNRVKRVLIPFLIFGIFWLIPLRLILGYPSYKNHGLFRIICWDFLI